VFRFSPWIASRTCVTVRPGGEPRRIQVDPDFPLLAADEPGRADVLDLLARIWLIARDVSTVIQTIGVSSSELTAWMTGASAASGGPGPG
jgi:hypothetical protein